MKIRNVYGYGSIVTISLIVGYAALAFLILSILGFGYGFWIWASISLVISLYFISIIVYILVKINKGFKPFKEKGGEVVEVELTQINLKGWMFTYNVPFKAIYKDEKIDGLLLASWTNGKLDAGKTVKAYKINDKFLLVKWFKR